jgi:ribosomal protein S18 acetylase RimI-like enzyme
MNDASVVDIERIERASLWAWPPRELFYVSGWLLRASGTTSRRLNSAQTLQFEAGADVAKAIQRAEAWYLERDLPPRFQLTDRAQPAGLASLLQARGYRPVSPTSVMVRPLENLPPADPAIDVETRVRQAVANALFDPQTSEEERLARTEVYDRIKRPAGFAVRYFGEEPVAAGCCVIDGEIAVIHSMHTHYPFRRMGHGRAVLDRLLEWARAMDARIAVLQVRDDNEPARRLYAQAGFQRHYGYVYYEKTGREDG